MPKFQGMKKVLLVIPAVLFLTLSGRAQTRIITGQVLDAVTKEFLPKATIRPEGTGSGILSNEEGKFTIPIPAGADKSTLVTSYTGYLPDTFQVIASQNSYIIYLQPGENRLHDVVVTTGVSRALSVRENPVSMLVVSSKAIDQSIGENIVDALAQAAPGFNSVKTGPGVSKPFIHGLGYNRVLTLYDGVRQESQQWGDEHGIIADDYNTERAEIIKGPASLMYGSDAIAGVLSLFPVMPVNTKGKITGRYTSEYQGNNGLFGNGMRLMYGRNRWSYMLRGTYRIAKNYQNPVDGWVYNSNFRTTSLSFTAIYRAPAGYTSLNGNLYDHKQAIPDGSRDSLTRQFTRQVYETSGNPADNIKDRPIVPEDALNTYLLSPLHQRIQDYKFYSNSHYAIGKGWLDGQLALTKNMRREFNHPTDYTQAGLYIRLFTLNYGIRYSVRIPGYTELTIGINGMYQDNKSMDATDFPIPDFRLFDAGPYVYLHRKFNNWAVTGGIRYDSRLIRGNDFYTRQDPSTGFFKQVLSGDTAGAYLQFPSFDKKFSGFSFSLGFTYQVTDHISLKANIARGFRAPNISEFASNGLDPGAHIVYLGNRDAQPEFSLQEDAGILFSFKNISASLSIFNNYIRNYLYEAQATDAQGNPVILVPGNKTLQYNQASAQLYGLEATLTLHPDFVKGFSFDNAFTILDGFNRNPVYKGMGVAGEYLPFMPPTRLLTGFSQEWQPRSSLFSSLTFKIQADINASQNQYLALNYTETPTSGYTLVNAAILVGIPYSKNYSLQFQLQANNLLNTIYQTNQSRLKYFEYYTASPNGRLGIFGMGRNICAKLILPF